MYFTLQLKSYALRLFVGGYDVFAAVVFHAIPGDGRPGAAGHWDYSIRINASELGVSAAPFLGCDVAPFGLLLMHGMRQQRTAGNMHRWSTLG